MTANVVLNPGSGGDTVKADDLTTYKIPAVKLVTGAATVDGGYVSPANGLPVAPVTAAYQSVVTITRPANVTAYTAGDVIGGAITLATIGPASGQVMRVTSINLEYNVAAIPSGMTTHRLYLYSVTPPSALADNAAFDLPSGDRASYLGYVDLGALTDIGSTLVLIASNINLPVKLAGTSIFGYLVTAGGFTPAANSETLRLTVNAEVV